MEKTDLKNQVMEIAERIKTMREITGISQEEMARFTGVTLEEYKEKIKPNQTDKDEKVVALYTTDLEQQFGYIDAAKNRSYDVVKLDSVIDAHFINHLEQKGEFTLKRVDADVVDKLIGL